MATRKRRSSGDGSVYRIETGRDAGKWCAQVDLGYDDHGRRQRPRRIRDTEKEAKRALKELLERRSAGVQRVQTVHQWLDYWIDHIVAPTSRPQTVTTRRSAVKHIKAGISERVTLLDLGPQHVRQMQATMRARGASPRRVWDVTATLGIACRAAVADRLMVRSPVAAVLAKTPKPGRTSHPALTWPQTQALFDATTDTRMRARLACSFMAGLRPSEALGLRWADIDLADEDGVWRGAIHVRGQRGRLGVTYAPTKTTRSLRTVPLEPAAASMLAAWRAVAPESEWVFPSHAATDAPQSQGSDRLRFAEALAAAGAPPITPHGARATFTSRLLDRGVSVAVAAKLLGDRPETLLAHYARSDDGVERAAIAALDAGVSAGPAAPAGSDTPAAIEPPPPGHAPA